MQRLVEMESVSHQVGVSRKERPQVGSRHHAASVAEA